MRLDKFLADSGVDTRSKCKEIIKKGKIKVNGDVIKDSAFSVSEKDVVLLDGNEVKTISNLYFVFHKPAGYICATKDEHQKTVLEFFPKELQKHLLIVGRLDKDTEGLLLLTNDGSFVHKLMSPKKHVEKTYYFHCENEIPTSAIAEIKEGIDIGDEKNTKPGELCILSYDKDRNISEGTLTISEGRYHQVKRMLMHYGCKVCYLKRISIGDLRLDDSLKLGEYRELRDDELRDFR